jgi:hypothetical protein
MNRLERLARDKHSCLLRKSVNYDRKKFYSAAPYQTFMTIKINIKLLKCNPLHLFPKNYKFHLIENVAVCFEKSKQIMEHPKNV